MIKIISSDISTTCFILLRNSYWKIAQLSRSRLWVKPKVHRWYLIVSSPHGQIMGHLLWVIWRKIALVYWGSEISSYMGAHLSPVGPRWAPCRPHGPCYLGYTVSVHLLHWYKGCHVCIANAFLMDSGGNVICVWDTYACIILYGHVACHSFNPSNASLIYIYIYIYIHWQPWGGLFCSLGINWYVLQSWYRFTCLMDCTTLFHVGRE